MDFTTHKKRVSSFLLVCFMVLCSIVLLGAKDWKEAKTVKLRNTSDSIMPFVELVTEGGGHYGGRYTEAQKSHAEMIQKYVDHMNSRHIPFLLRLLPFSKNNIVKCLEEVVEELKIESSSEEEAHKKIKKAAESIAPFYSELGILTNELIFAPEPEVMSQDIRDAIEDALNEAHAKAEIYAKNPSVATSEDACMSNRRAIVYLYLDRFGYHSFVTEEELKQFRTDINRTIYHNRLLQQNDTIKAQYDELIKAGKSADRSDYSMLEKHSESERRRLRLLQSIIDDNIYEAQLLLTIAIKQAISEDQNQISVFTQ